VLRTRGLRVLAACLNAAAVTSPPINPLLPPPPSPPCAGNGRITFAHPTTQQQLLVWRDRPRTVMVIKKLGRELNSQFFEVVRYLGETEGMRVIVEPAMYDEARSSRQVEGEWLHTFEPQERERCGAAHAGRCG
jgi:hypothetical protein